jgi:hypothetical protein
MSPSPALHRLVRHLASVLVLATGVLAASAAERKLEARLIWGTNDEKSPNPQHKKLDADISKRLEAIPFKWKNYFEVNRQTIVINDQSYTRTRLSPECEIEIKDKGDSKVTVKLYGKGVLVKRVDKGLPKGEILNIGGDANGSNAWMILVRAADARDSKLDSKIAVQKSNELRAKPVEPKK